MSGLFSAQTNPNKLPELLIKSELSRPPSFATIAYTAVVCYPPGDDGEENATGGTVGEFCGGKD